MNVTASQLSANVTKRPEKLFKHFKTAVGAVMFKLDSVSLFHYSFQIQFIHCTFNLCGNGAGLLENISLSVRAVCV